MAFQSAQVALALSASAGMLAARAKIMSDLTYALTILARAYGGYAKRHRAGVSSHKRFPVVTGLTLSAECHMMYRKSALGRGPLVPGEHSPTCPTS